MEQTLETNDLSKHFGDAVAVDRLDLSIDRGEIFGLLGPNAAGKSTTIRLLSGILRPDGGSATVLGLDLMRQTEEIKHHIGYVAQNFALYPDLSVIENIEFYAGLYGIQDEGRFEELLEIYELSQFRDKRSSFLSGGFKRRLAMACATAHDPDLVFLDEPTAGIDPVTRKELWDLFYTLSNQGKTLFVTTHYMEEAERCNRLAFLNKGKKIAEGTPQELCDSLSDVKVITFRLGYDPELTRQLVANDDVRFVNQMGNQYRVIVDNMMTTEQLQAIIARSRSESVTTTETMPTIEDTFMALTHEDMKR